MTQPNRENYEAAQARIVAGKWWVDPLIGFVYGSRGQPFRMVNLEAVTPTGLNVPRRGMESANARLTDSQVREIYDRAWAGEFQPAIGADYGVTREIVSNIKQGWAWTHITGHQRVTA